MQPTTQISPFFFLVGAIALFVLGVMAGRKLSGRWRWFTVAACILPMMVLLGVAWHLWQGIREDARQSREIFTAINPGPDFADQEQSAFLTLSRSSPRVRARVMRLAFANPTNATLALPRMEILLQAALQLDEMGKGREHLWNAVVQPALGRRPFREAVLLAAATASIGGYGSNQVAQVLRLLTPLISAETNLQFRSIELGLFVPLADFASMEQIEAAANLLLPELLAETNPMLVNIKAGSLEPAGSRRVRDLRRLASRLSGASARRFADEVIPPLGTQTNPSCALALGKVLVEVKAALDTEQVDRALTNLIRQLSATNGGVMQDRAIPLASLVEVVTPEQAVKTTELLLGTIRSEPNDWWRGEQTRPLKLLAQKLPDVDGQRLAEPMAAVSPDLVPLIRDRIPREQAYDWVERMLQGIIDTPNPTRRGSQVGRVGPVAVRLTAEQTGKLADELWRILLKDRDDSRQSHEADCLIALAPQLSDEQAASLAERVVEQMAQPESVGLPVLMKLLTPLLGRANQATVENAVAHLMNPPDRPQLALLFGTGLAQRSFLLGAHLSPAQIKLVLEPLVKAMEQHDNPESYIGPISLLTPLADQLAPDQMERVADRLVTLYTQKPKSFGLIVLNRLATNVTVTPQQAKQIFDQVLPGALECRLPQSDTFVKSAELFARLLDPEHAEESGKIIISIMGRMSEQMCAVLDARCLLPLTNVLRADQARRLADQLLQIPAQRGDRPGLDSVMDGSRGPSPSADWMLPWEFVERQESWRYRYRLEAWSRSLAAMLERTTKEVARIVADQVAARCAEHGESAPMLFEEQTAVVLQHASDASLNKILQTPFAVGGLRRIVLRALELKTGKAFHGNKWEFTTSMAVTNTN